MAISCPSFNSVPFTLEPMFFISSCPISSTPIVLVEVELERKFLEVSFAYTTHPAVDAVTSFPSFFSFAPCTIPTTYAT